VIGVNKDKVVITKIAPLPLLSKSLIQFLEKFAQISAMFIIIGQTGHLRVTKIS
jgi:hypothetical protein